MAEQISKMNSGRFNLHRIKVFSSVEILIQMSAQKNQKTIWVLNKAGRLRLTATVTNCGIKLHSLLVMMKSGSWLKQNRDALSWPIQLMAALPVRKHRTIGGSRLTTGL